MHPIRLPAPASRRFSVLVLSASLIAVLVGCATTAAPPTAASAPLSTPSAPTAAPPPQGRTAPDTFTAYRQWVAAFRAAALSQGVREATLRAALDPVEYLPRVIELDRAQPEFTRAVWSYLDNAVSPQRIATGLEKLPQVRREAEAAAARYGVPVHILVAIWGMESNYGGNYGNTPTVDALATLGFDGRREAWARTELLAALKIIDSGDIDHDRMIGSWAGAMGQTQFMPSNFLAYAVDADGDGRRDIWGSMADVMASTANFLARSGWQAGEPWGVEVQLPAGFDHGRADPKVRQSASAWAAEGVRSVDGQALPAMAESTVFLPAGARGPAFLTGRNFNAILRYNNSTSYALAVGVLARQLAGESGVQAAWPRDLAPLSRAQVTSLQTALNALGFATGVADGVMGPATREGVRQYQRSAGLPADGFPDVALLQRLEAR